MRTSRHFGTTQRDIARALDISRASVAIALNPKTRHKLLPETTSKIEIKAKELNYHPQRQARILRSGRSHTIGVVCHSGEFTYHAPQERVRHLACATIRVGYQLISLDMTWFAGNTAPAQNYLLDVAAEGIIFCNLAEHHQLDWWEFSRERSLPVVSMSSTFDGVDQASFDLQDAYRAMTLHHIGQGSRNLHLVLPFHDPSMEGKSPSWLISDRVQGFMEAIRSMGGEVIAEPETGRFLGVPLKFSSRKPAIRGHVHYPIRTELYENAFDIGYYEALRILQSKKADSFVCSNDDVAAGALSACGERDLDVPKDVRISGADDAPFARRGKVPLSTIAQPSQDMAEWCIQRLVELIENPNARKAPKSRVFPCELIFRKSTILSSPKLKPTK